MAYIDRSQTETDAKPCKVGIRKGISATKENAYLLNSTMQRVYDERVVARALGAALDSEHRWSPTLPEPQLDKDQDELPTL